MRSNWALKPNNIKTMVSCIINSKIYFMHSPQPHSHKLFDIKLMEHLLNFYRYCSTKFWRGWVWSKSCFKSGWVVCAYYIFRCVNKMLWISFLDDNPSGLTQDEPNFDRADREFIKRFVENKFGVACSVCDRLWFINDLKTISEAAGQVLLQAGHFESVANFKACQTCRSSLQRGSVPTLSSSNGFVYPCYPPNLPPLDPISERLISPRLPFMQIRRLRQAQGLIFVYSIVVLTIFKNIFRNYRQLYDCRTSN